LNDMYKFCRLCKKTYLSVKQNEYFDKLSTDIKNGLHISYIFNRGDIHICKLLYIKYSKLVNNKDIIMIGNQTNIIQYVSTDRFDIILNMTNAFQNYCLKNFCGNAKWFTSNNGICSSNNEYLFVNKITDDDINKIFIIVCENNKYNNVKWLFVNYNISDLSILTAFMHCLKLEYLDVCEFLFDNCDIVRFLINFNFENLIDIYRNNNRENIIKWLKIINK